MLIGSYNHTIDTKGRLFVPSKWREDMGATFIVTKGTGKCLFGMSIDKWNVFSTKLASLPLADKQAQEFVRYISAWAIDCEIDKQGRILLPLKLRTFANLKEDATLIGVTSRIEIWDSAAWDEHDKEIETNYDDILQKMAQMGI